MKVLRYSAVILFVLVALATFGLLLYNAGKSNIEQPIAEKKIFDPGFIPFKELGSDSTGIQVVPIDTCQYIIITGKNKITGFHKENCSNPVHKKF